MLRDQGVACGVYDFIFLIFWHFQYLQNIYTTEINNECKAASMVCGTMNLTNHWYSIS